MKSGGLLWFITFSYRQYIAPKGLKEHLKFAWQLPGAMWRYLRAYQEPRP